MKNMPIFRSRQPLRVVLNVCPVKIDIHDQLYKWRQVIAKEGYVAGSKAVKHESYGLYPSSPTAYQAAGKAGRWFLKLCAVCNNNKFNPWYKQRDMPTGLRNHSANGMLNTGK